MNYTVDPDKIKTTKDLLTLVKFLLTHTKLIVKSQEVDIDKIQHLLRESDSGTGN